ncbi:MAG TPA: TRAP transporter small permease subunit [Chloroflexota bacterium]|nr:TRAP transporter small permease subunit [Chloroflexota bacterium]
MSARAAYQALDRALERLEGFIVTVGLVLSVGSTLVEVILRNSSTILTAVGMRQSSSLGGGGEFAQMTMIWAALIGAAMGMRAGIHIGVDVLVQRLPARGTKAMLLLGIAVGMAFTASVMVLGWRLVAFSHDSGQVTAELFFPRWLLYLSVPVSMALMTLHQAQVFVELWRRPATQVKRAAQAEVAAMADAEAEAARA